MSCHLHAGCLHVAFCVFYHQCIGSSYSAHPGPRGSTVTFLAHCTNCSCWLWLTVVSYCFSFSHTFLLRSSCADQQHLLVILHLLWKEVVSAETNQKCTMRREWNVVSLFLGQLWPQEQPFLALLCERTNILGPIDKILQNLLTQQKHVHQTKS